MMMKMIGGGGSLNLNLNLNLGVVWDCVCV